MTLNVMRLHVGFNGSAKLKHQLYSKAHPFNTHVLCIFSRNEIITSTRTCAIRFNVINTLIVDSLMQINHDFIHWIMGMFVDLLLPKNSLLNGCKVFWADILVWVFALRTQLIYATHGAVPEPQHIPMCRFDEPISIVWSGSKKKLATIKILGEHLWLWCWGVTQIKPIYWITWQVSMMRLLRGEGNKIRSWLPPSGLRSSSIHHPLHHKELLLFHGWPVYQRYIIIWAQIIWRVFASVGL